MSSAVRYSSRQDINHDWLKNRWMPAIGKIVRVLEGAVEDTTACEEFARRLTTEFPGALAAVRQLSSRAENEASPRALFEEFPLSRCDDEMKAVLGRLVHEEWVARTGIGKKVAALDRAVRDAEVVAGATVSLLLDRDLSRQDREQVLVQMRAFQAACRELSARISALPDTVAP